MIDMKRVFFWAGMKKDVAEYVARCLVCQQVKAEQKKPGGLLHPLEVPLWKWESVSMDFIDGLPRLRKGNTGIWVVVDRLTKSAHFYTYEEQEDRSMASFCISSRDSSIAWCTLQYGERSRSYLH